MTNIKNNSTSLCPTCEGNGYVMKGNNMEKRLENLEDVIKIQCSNGNWNYDPYMHGMANGMLLARHVVLGTEEECHYLDAPKKWLKDYPSFWVKLKWKIFGVPVSSEPSVQGNCKNTIVLPEEY